MTATIRPARPSDADAIEQIENDADRLLVAHLRPDTWSPAPPGAERLATAGFVLVVESMDGVVVGFVDVIEVDDVCHLEQLSVRPEHCRRGHGRALVEAAKQRARALGHQRISLRTYADVPWNAPFYATAGFTEEEPVTPFHRSLVDVEARLGIDRWGRRVQMSAPVS
ncbi:GNAT family N-acetyltransferase [Microbacterium sp. M1A1_1b]